MKSLILNRFVLSLTCVFFFATCKKDDTNPREQEKTLSGFLYTTTNGESTNQVIKIDRFSDGTFGNEICLLHK